VNTLVIPISGIPTTPLFLAPSVTPGSAHNPGIRLVKYDRDTGKHLDLEQYYLDLEVANKDDAANWTLEYKATDVYQIRDLTATSLTQLVKKMKGKDSYAFKKYWLHYTVTVPEHLRNSCEDECHSIIMCGFTKFYTEPYNTCIAVRTSGAQTMETTLGLHISLIMLLVYKSV